MKRFFSKIAIVSYCISSFMPCLSATSLIGTSNIVYQPNLYTFANGDQAKGAVYLNGGFKVNAGHGVRINLSVPVKSLLDLSSTGSIILENNLRLDSGTILASGGTINGGGYTLSLNDSFTIQAMTTLKVTSTLVIDGNGHTLFVDKYGQLLVESHSTLTLKNLILKNYSNTPGFPPIATNNSDSKIAFDNVKMYFNNDFWFNKGSFFIHNDVFFSGGNSFVFHSNIPSYIASNGTFTFDNDSTFYYYPQADNDALICMRDASSNLFLNGSTLRTTFTGMTVSDGVVWLKDKSEIKGGTGVINGMIPYTSRKYGATVNVVSWSPDGKFLAIGGSNPTSGAGGFSNAYQVRIYKLDLSSGSQLIPFSSIDYGHDTLFSRVSAISWSWDGRYLAIAGKGATSGAGGFNNSDEIRIYRFDLNDGAVTPVASKPFGTNVYCLNWHPSKYFLLATGTGASATGIFAATDRLRVYVLDPNTLILSDFARAACDSTSVRVAKWSPEGTYIALGDCIYGGTMSATSASLKIFSFQQFAANISDRLTLFASVPLVEDIISAAVVYTTGLDWTQDGRFVSVGGTDIVNHTSYIYIYEFDPADPSPLALFVYRMSGVEACATVDFNKDDTLLIAGLWNPSYAQNDAVVKVFKFNKDSENQDVRLYSSSAMPYGGNGGGTPPYSYGEADSLCVDFNQEYNLAAIGGVVARYFGYKDNRDELQLYNTLQDAQEVVDSKIYTQSDGSSVYAAEFSFDEQFVAVGGIGAAAVDGFTTQQALRVYKFNKVSEKLNPLCGVQPGYGDDLSDLKWSPDGKYIAIAGVFGWAFGLYQFDGTSLTQIISPSSGYEAQRKVSWHPSGKYLALDRKIYQLKTLAGVMYLSLIKDLVVAVNEIAWSPDGKYLAVAGTTYMAVYDFNALLTPAFPTPISSNIYTTFGLGVVSSIDWSSVDNYIAISGRLPSNTADGFTTNDTVRVYKFTGSGVTKVSGAYVGGNSSATSSIRFTPDHRNLIFIDTDASVTSAHDYYLLAFENDTLSELFYENSAGYIEHRSVGVSPTGRYLAFGSLYTTFRPNSTLFIRKLTQAADIYHSTIGLNLVTPLDVRVLAGSRVGINGIVNYED